MFLFYTDEIIDETTGSIFIKLLDIVPNNIRVTNLH